MVKVKVDAAVGVPLSTPCGLRVRPEGNVPLTSPNTSVPEPPVVVMVAL